MVTLQSADNTLKSVYLEVIRNQINMNSDIVFGKIKQTIAGVWGKEIKKTIKDSKGNYVELKEELRNFYGAIELSDKAIRASQNNASAFVELLNAECEDLIRKAIVEIKDQLWNKDRVVKRELSDGTVEELFDKKIVGISEIFDTTKETIYGCKRAEVPQLNPTIKEVEEFTEMSIIEAIDDMEQKCSVINFIVCSYATKRKLLEEFRNKGNPIEVLDLQGGFNVIVINRVPVVPVSYLEDNEIYLLNTNDFTFNQLCDWQWLEDSEGKILTQKVGKLSYQATLVKYGNLICDNINNQCLVKLKGEKDEEEEFIDYSRKGV